MDWTKAKTIIIVALLVTNLFLIFTYGFNKSEKNEKDNQALISILANNNIYLLCEIPKPADKLPVLYVEYTHINKEEITSSIRSGSYKVEASSNDSAYIDMASKFIRENNLQFENIVVEGISKENEFSVVSYINVVDDIKLEESFVKCYFNNGKLEKVEAYWLNSISYSSGKNDIISASKALISFMNQVVEKDQVINIENIELVYWLDIENLEWEEFVKDTALPTWKITYNNGKSIHIYSHEQ